MMLTTHRFLIILSLLVSVALSGCRDMGSVEQGLVVAFDGNAGRATLILDSNAKDPNRARYDRVPPVVVNIPTDSAQMGPVPEAGGLISVDTDASQIVLYDYSSKQLKTISFQLVDRVGNVYPDDSRLSDAALPKVDRASKQVTIYSPRSREIVTATVPDDCLDLPKESWKAGDEVRYYFKDPSQALRMMNVSRTKIS